MRNENQFLIVLWGTSVIVSAIGIGLTIGKDVLGVHFGFMIMLVVSLNQISDIIDGDHLEDRLENIEEELEELKCQNQKRKKN